MADASDKGPRPDLARALASGRQKGALLAAWGNPTLTAPDARRRELESQLAEAERRFAQSAALWTREWAATTVRAVRRALGPDDAELIARAEALDVALEAKDNEELGPLREALRAGRYGPEDYRRDLARLPSYAWDAFTQRLFELHRVPERLTERPAGMVHYVPSSLRVIFGIVELLGPEDVFYDIGSGLGLVTLLVAWLSPARAVGVEYEPAYHEIAVARAEALRIPRLDYVHADARYAGYDDGTVFYVYDTFRDTILEDMIRVLRAQAERRTIRVLSRGHSTPVFDQVPWLLGQPTANGELMLYTSLPAGGPQTP